MIDKLIPIHPVKFLFIIHHSSFLIHHLKSSSRRTQTYDKQIISEVEALYLREFYGLCVPRCGWCGKVCVLNCIIILVDRKLC
jgi:hypothetical protein